jgi:hypothetical protein
MTRRLANLAASLVGIERTTGKRLVLALEPEPACFLETTADAVAFFQDELLGAASLTAFAELTGLDASGAEHALRRHVGVCLDACHASVEFEQPHEALATLRAAGIAVPKLQLSAGLRVAPVEPSTLEALRSFADEVYLHQTVARDETGALVRFLDLGEALDAARNTAFSELRVHFHVPVFERELAPFSSTQDDLARVLEQAGELPPHLEVETYTFDVLPERFRTLSVTQAIARELEWARARLAERR